MDHYEIILISESRSPESATVRVHDDTDDCRIDLTFGTNVFDATAEDFFDCFCRIREQLEPLGLVPKCYAAHLRAYPSGMSRSMGGGLELYRLTPGSSARTTDLVHMFDSDEGVVPATVAEQRQFFEAWLVSLG